MTFEKILTDFLLSAFAPANAQSRLKTLHRIVFNDVTPCNPLPRRLTTQQAVILKLSAVATAWIRERFACLR